MGAEYTVMSKKAQATTTNLQSENSIYSAWLISLRIIAPNLLNLCLNS